MVDQKEMLSDSGTHFFTAAAAASRRHSLLAVVARRSLLAVIPPCCCCHCRCLQSMYVPKDRVTNLHQGYGFVEFRSEEDADYAIKVLNMIKLDGMPIRVNKVLVDHTNSKIGTDAPPSSTPNWTINVLDVRKILTKSAH
ncbi:hypothetical protein TEA_002558 [Camellia sinensis var. sinensis]|uniref:RRM domain-containing protein n=1 Tax=Camellia sinensis var. sinensis TaxID=542762 RepID=A0A4S4DGW2_CAMSN|nr:hypothetical protein TEA_002558 [Camellia sinensis var. sinensis]